MSITTIAFTDRLVGQLRYVCADGRSRPGASLASFGVGICPDEMMTNALVSPVLTGNLRQWPARVLAQDKSRTNIFLLNLAHTARSQPFAYVSAESRSHSTRVRLLAGNFVVLLFLGGWEC